MAMGVKFNSVAHSIDMYMLSKFLQAQSIVFVAAPDRLETAHRKSGLAMSRPIIWSHMFCPVGVRGALIQCMQLVRCPTLPCNLPTPPPLRAYHRARSFFPCRTVAPCALDRRTGGGLCTAGAIVVPRCLGTMTAWLNRELGHDSLSSNSRPAQGAAIVDGAGAARGHRPGDRHLSPGG